MPVSPVGAASNHSCCSRCQFLPEQINTASSKWCTTIDLEKAVFPCPISRRHQKQLAKNLDHLLSNRTTHKKLTIQITRRYNLVNRRWQALQVGYTNMVCACHRVGAKCHENTEICPVSKGLVVRCVYQAIPSKVKHTLLCLVPRTTKKSDTWEAFLDFGINTYHN